MESFYGKFPTHPRARRWMREQSRRLAHQRRMRHEAARAASEAEIAARYTTEWILGTAVAARSAWEGRSDGTATGVIDGLSFRFAPSSPGDAHLSLLRRCYVCGARWSAPVRSEGQLIGALVEDRCGCTRCRTSSPRPSSPTRPVRWPRRVGR